jgi:hypothetical protein
MYLPISVHMITVVSLIDMFFLFFFIFSGEILNLELDLQDLLTELKKLIEMPQ